MAERKICVVTGGRADYGLLIRLIKEIGGDPELKLQVIATGMHLSPEFGLTHREIENDGIYIDAKVETVLSSDTDVGITKSIGLGIIGFADVLDRLQPDIIVVLGDRFEILAAAQAALMAHIPIAHVHGGEVTEGAIDESIRHAVTKMAHLHFVAAEPFRQRVIQMGEDPQRVFNVGAPGLDQIEHVELLSRTQFEDAIGFELGKLNFLVTYHPVTLGARTPEDSTRALLAALDEFPDAKIIFTKPNADAGGRAIFALLDAYAKNNRSRACCVVALGQRRYFSAVALADAVIGNSSSGLIEVPHFKTPTVNIGERQRGRPRAESVIDCEDTATAITAAIRQALAPNFRQRLPHSVSPYGRGGASARIRQILKMTPLDGILIKRFHDLGTQV